MDTVLEHRPAALPSEPATGPGAMAVEVAVNASRYHAVPCKKRPFSWYKPPASPGTSPSPPRPASPASPCSLSSSSSSAHEDMLWSPSVAPSVAPLLWSSVPYSPLLHAMARSLTTPRTLGPFTPASAPTSTPQPAAVRKQSDFSIEHILKDAGRSSSSSSSPPPAAAHPDGQFEWLNCTRYRPPKLPRTRRRDGPAQRRLGRNPRIPFSPHQVAVLEGRFRRSHYLSSADVAELSAELELSETRVKIWFQNRRARERRDGEGRCRSAVSPPRQAPVQSAAPAPLALAKGPVKAPTPSQLPRSQVSAFSAPKSSTRPSPGP